MVLLCVFPSTWNVYGDVTDSTDVSFEVNVTKTLPKSCVSGRNVNRTTSPGVVRIISRLDTMKPGWNWYEALRYCRERVSFCSTCIHAICWRHCHPHVHCYRQLVFNARENDVKSLCHSLEYGRGGQTNDDCSKTHTCTKKLPRAFPSKTTNDDCSKTHTCKKTLPRAFPSKT